ncbi:hypothetical protein [Tepidibacter thalassicus]|uniref:Repeat domain-containing protein n=1 Tax=Tepidibacter thalassicus DSM 15285 TaxID=1123350 RepID=A0A1M5QTI8_9FIRM|nr:hypothetical protein [Tepidibacter thalassicus]SHH17425.1 hypothetical protein SAMN02744040_01098 [Tepidibacter thalassicus DSM 15285]
MLKKLNVFITTIIMIFILSSCSAIKSPVNIIKKPRVLENVSEIQSIESRFLSDKDRLTLAISQKNEKSIRRVDLDGDGNDEILLLYRSNEGVYDEINSYGIVILKKKKGEWYEINRIEEHSHGIDLVQYKDITGDNIPEIFIGYTFKDTLSKSMSVYSYHGGYFRIIYDTDYEDFALDDLNYDKKNELIFLDRLSDDSTVIRVLNYVDENVNLIDEYTINNDSYYSTMKVGNVSKNKKGIFVDFYMGINSLYTDLFILDNNKLINISE